MINNNLEVIASNMNELSNLILDSDLDKIKKGNALNMLAAICYGFEQLENVVNGTDEETEETKETEVNVEAEAETVTE